MKSTLPPLVAHRGESALAPENTLAAIELAWRNGADAVEIDIWMTRDRQFILCHDRDTFRTAGEALNIPDHTADELRRLDIGQWMGPQWRGERMPLLDEAIALTPPAKRVYVEMKSGVEGVPALAETLRAQLPSLERRGGGRVERPSDELSPLTQPLPPGAEGSKTSPASITLICFALPILAELRRLLPDHPMYLLANIPRQEPGQPTEQQLIDRLITQARQHRFNGLDLHHKLLNDKTVRQIHDAGVEAHGWTVDDPAEAKRLITAGVDSITTNHPSHLRRVLG